MKEDITENTQLISHSTVVEPEEKKRESCCSVTTVRRTWRIFILSLIIIILAVIPFLVILFSYSYLKFYTDTSRPFKFVLEDCKLYIAEDNSLALDKVYIAADVPGNF